MVAREMARVDGSMNTFLGVHSNLCMGALNLLGSPEQKERWLPPLASIEKTGAFALTEPDHGPTRSRWRPRPPGGRRVGHRRTQTMDRQRACRRRRGAVRPQRRRRQRERVRRREGRPRTPPRLYYLTVITGKIGKRAILQADIVIEDMRASWRRTDWPSATPSGTSACVLQATRGGAAWEAVGHAMACFEIAADYASRRVSSELRSSATSWSSPVSPTCSAS